MEHPERYRYFQLMELSGCLTEYELMQRVGSSLNMAKWLVYLQLRDERENERMKAMFGTQEG